MAAYDYRCRTCESVFEVRRSVTAEANGVRCPDGHDDVARIWSAVAVAVGGAGSAGFSAEPVRSRSAAGRPFGGCCGGACGCG